MLLAADHRKARVSLVPDGALLLAGDAVRVEVTVDTGATLELVEPTGTVAYDMRGDAASWEVRLDLAEGATLVWAGEPFVLAQGSCVRRRTTARLAAGARLVMRETLVLGRHGESAGAMVQRWDAATTDGAPLLCEELALDAAALRPGLLGGHRVLGSVTALGVDVPGCGEGRLDLEAGGSQWRVLADDAHAARLSGVWEAVVAAAVR